MSAEAVTTIPPPAPPPGAAADPAPPPPVHAAGVCANCGEALHGPFCAQCGQHIKDVHQSCWRFVIDFFDNVFSWDSKVFRTLQPLVARPGALTLDYLSGHRVRYVHPLRLFLFTSAICLTIIQYLGGSPVQLDTDDKPSRKHGSGFNVNFGDSSPTPAPAEANPSPESSPAAEASPSPSPVAIPAAPAPLAGTAPLPSPAGAPAKNVHRRGSDDDDDDDDLSKSIHGLVQQIDQAAAEKVNAAQKGVDQAEASPPPGEGFGDRLSRKVEKMSKNKVERQRVQKETAEGVQSRVSWVALALLPIFALMLRSLYWRQDSYYFAHFVFSLHYHTFLLLFFAACTLGRLVLPTSFPVVHGVLQLVLLLVPGAYLFLALRRMYAENTRRLLAKVLVLGVMHLGILLLSLTIVGGLAFYRALG